MKLLIILMFAIFISGCSSEKGSYAKSERVTNQLIKNIPNPWKEINSEGSDFALANSRTKSIFLFNSACRKYEGSDLKALTSSLLTGLEDLQILEKKITYFQEREASELKVSGKLDGVLRYLKIITIQKNNCIYDYVLISSSSNLLDQDLIFLNDFLKRIVLN